MIFSRFLRHISAIGFHFYTPCYASAHGMMLASAHLRQLRRFTPISLWAAFDYYGGHLPRKIFALRA